MNIQKNVSLKNYNTFGIEVFARKFVAVHTVDELQTVLAKHKHDSLFILGGGSNMLLKKNVDALVIHIDLKGIEVISETEEQAEITCMAGENWHHFVQYCIHNNYGGLENLSLIPGNVGTSPIQNIGAYGVELKDVFKQCTAVEIATGNIVTFTKDECKFGYRDSIFKTTHKGKYIITSVTFVLTKKNHNLNIAYGAITSELEAHHIKNPTIKDVSNAVIAIRNSKLPDPKLLGNSGSFFKNPVIEMEEFTQFIKNFPEAPFYKVSETSYKIPAGWLIEKAGFKGKRYGDAGVHKNQALVLVNYGEATGQEIWDLALHIKQKVFHLFNITIEPEVNIIG